MGISHDIISEFVKITNDKKEKSKEETVYATIVQASDGKYVKLDGSDLITPTETTTDIEEGERVTVLIKDHSAIITGNISSPSASVNRVNGIVDVVSEKLGVFETIVADKIDVNELNAYKATIEHLIVGKAEIDDLEAARAKIGFLDADVAHIKTLVAGNLTSDNILSFNITADKVTMADAFIKDAMVDTINAAKINAGRLNTNNVIIGSDDGGMLISGATQQFTDKNGQVRIQIGRDSTGDFTFVLYGEDGTGQIINQNGITASAVSDGLIVNDMINDKAAISGGKLDISSVIFEINNENDTAIHSSKIYLDEQNQSLEAAFNSLKTQVDTIVDISIDGDLKAYTEQIQSNTAKIEMNKSSIDTLVSEDAIIRKEVSDLEGNLIEKTNTLSSKYSSLEQNMDGFKLEVADVYAKKTSVEDLENNLTTNYTTTEAMNSAITQKADEITSTVNSNYTTLNNKFNDYSTTTQMNSAITQKANEIALSVTKSELEDIQVGTNNLLLNSSFEYGTKYWEIYDSENTFPMPNGYDGGKCLKVNGALNRNRSATFVCSGIIPDTEYTLTGYIRTMDITPGTTNFLLGFLISFYKDDKWVDEIRLSEPSLETHWFRKRVLSFRTLKSDEYDTMEISCYARDFTGSVWFDHLKLTQGNKESDWSPAPSELSDRITDTEASIKINTDNIALKASKTEVQNLTNRVTTAESSIKINADNIALKASKTDVQNLTNRVTTAESKITDTAITNVVKNNFYTKDQCDNYYATQSQLEQTSTNLTATIKQSNGYNELLNGSFDTRDFSNWTVTASDAGVTQHATTLRYRARVKCVSGVNRGFQQTVRLLSGQWYTVSTNVVVDSGVVAGLEVSYNGKYFGTRTNNYGYFSNGILHYTFKADENTDANVLFYVDGKSYGDTGAGGNAYFYYVQLEKGQVATAFSPHPNEIYTTNAVFDKNGLRVNQTNVNTYTRMNSNGFFVNMNDGNTLFEASDKIALYDGRGTSCMIVVNDPDASYGNARIDLRGGINFIHNPGTSVGKNQILLGNDDRADLYGYHNLSIRAHNSLGFMDNNGYTNMYFATRTGSIVMKGTVYQNSQSGMSTFSLLRSREVVNDYGYTTEDMVNSILTLETSVNVDENEDYSMRICSSENELVTKILGDSLHIDQGSVIAGLVETVKSLNNRILELESELNK